MLLRLKINLRDGEGSTWANLGKCPFGHELGSAFGQEAASWLEGQKMLNIDLIGFPKLFFFSSKVDARNLRPVTGYVCPGCVPVFC